MKARGKKKKKTAAAKKPQPPLLRVAEDMKEWSALLGAELETWPGVSARPMFGMVAFYRGKKIFAAVPRTRALGSPNSFIFKLEGASAAVERRALNDARVNASAMGAAKWLAMEVFSAADLRPALEWLDRAYRIAA